MLVDKSRESRSLFNCFLSFITRAKQIINYLNRGFFFLKKKKDLKEKIGVSGGEKKLHLNKAKSQSNVCWSGQAVDLWSDRKTMLGKANKMIVILEVKV